MDLPPELKRGPRVVREAFNALRLWAISQRPLPSLDCDVHDTPAGRVILPRLGAGGVAPSAAAVFRPFQMRVVSPTEEIPQTRIRVHASTLAGGSSTDIGFAEGDDPPYLLTAAEGVLQGGITINSEGEVDSRWLEIVSELSADTEDAFHIEIGTLSENEGIWTVNNSCYGPVRVAICRNWFAAEAPFFNVALEGAG